MLQALLSLYRINIRKRAIKENRKLDMDFNSYRMRQRPVYMVFEGVVTHLEIAPGMMGRYDGCTQMVTVENEAGNTVNFFNERLNLRGRLYHPL